MIAFTTVKAYKSVLEHNEQQHPSSLGCFNDSKRKLNHIHKTQHLIKDDKRVCKAKSRTMLQHDAPTQNVLHVSSGTAGGCTLYYPAVYPHFLSLTFPFTSALLLILQRLKHIKHCHTAALKTGVIECQKCCCFLSINGLI